MRKIITSVGIIFLLSAFALPTKKAPIVINAEFQFPADFTVTNPCNGAEVSVTGMLNITIHGVINNNRVAITGHNMGHLTGTDNEGNTYNANLINFFPINGSLINNQFKSINHYKVMYRGAGSASDFTVSNSSQITINANGEVTVVRETGSFDGQCLGK